MNKMSIVGLGLTVSLLVSACSQAMPLASPTVAEGETAGPPGNLTPVSLGVGFIPSVQFAPFYVGMAKGFFADEGIDLDLDYGFENDYLKLVGVNESQFMVGSGDQVVLGRAQGLPVRYIMNWYTQYPVVAFALAEAGIEEPADLAGKTIGIPGPFGANYVALRGLLEAAGLGEEAVTLESIGFTQAAAISAGTVDAAVDYAVNGPVVLGLEGIPTNQITLDSHLQIPANGLVTNEATIADNPALVAKMVRAAARAIDYTLQNPDEAFEIALGFVPEAGGENEAANRAVFDASLPYWQPREGRVIGESTHDEWAATAEFMQRIGLVDSLVPADELFTNDFVMHE